MRLAAALRVAFLFIAASLVPLDTASAQNAVALTGQVTSAEEGAMEGVLVSAKKGTITITVVSDEQGRYSFPASKLAPGQYTLSIRAIGYDLDNSKTVEVGPRRPPPTTSRCARPRTSPRRCRTANGCTASPAPTSRRALLLSCVGCHTLERFMRSTHDADTLIDSHAAAHARLRQPEHPAEPANADGRAADGGARRSARPGLPQRRQVSQQR